MNFYAVSGAKDGFKKPTLDFINVEHLNVTTHHDGGRNPGPLRHPKSILNLLGYSCPTSPFLPGITPQGGLDQRYALFKKYTF